MASLLSRALDWLSGGAVPALSRPIGPVHALDLGDMSDPRLIEFVRDGNMSVAGIGVNAHVALRNSTFLRAVTLISGAVGMLPLNTMQQDADGTNKREARKHPLWALLHRRPNKYQTALEFKALMQSRALMDGNAYAIVARSGRRIVGLMPMPRHSVQQRFTPDYTDVEFLFTPPNGGGQRVLTSRDVFHFRHPISIDGLHGIALLRMASDTIGIAAVAQRAAGRLFRNGSFAQGTLETSKALGDDVHRRIKEDWAEMYSGSENSGRWPILEEGLSAKPLISARDAEMTGTRQYEAEEVSRFTGAPRPLLMFDETSWGSGISQLSDLFVTYCLQPWFVSWEQAILRALEPDEQDTIYGKFDASQLLRGTPQDQASFFSKALGAGGSAPWMTPDEVRQAFDMNPVDGGDSLPPRSGAGSVTDQNSTDTPPAAPPPPRKQKEN